MSLMEDNIKAKVWSVFIFVGLMFHLMWLVYNKNSPQLSHRPPGLLPEDLSPESLSLSWTLNLSDEEEGAASSQSSAENRQTELLLSLTLNWVIYLSDTQTSTKLKLYQSFSFIFFAFCLIVDALLWSFFFHLCFVDIKVNWSHCLMGVSHPICNNFISGGGAAACSCWQMCVLNLVHLPLLGRPCTDPCLFLHLWGPLELWPYYVMLLLLKAKSCSASSATCSEFNLHF